MRLRLFHRLEAIDQLGGRWENFFAYIHAWAFLVSDWEAEMRFFGTPELAHRQLAGFESRADVRTWLTRITVNCAIDHIRGRRYRELAHDPADLQLGPLGERAAADAPAADRLLFGVEVQERLAMALTSLTTLERAAFMLRHVEGLSIDEIGTALDLRTSATKHCIFRAVRKMRVALASFAGA